MAVTTFYAMVTTYFSISLLASSLLAVQFAVSQPMMNNSSVDNAVGAEASPVTIVADTTDASLELDNSEVNGTVATLQNESFPDAICYDVKQPRSDFNCAAAYHSFLRDFDQSKEYIWQQKSWFPFPLPYSHIQLPRSWSDGSCKITISLTKAKPVMLAKVNYMRKRIGAILLKCIKDEKNSAGGILTDTFEGNIPGLVNDFWIDISQTNEGRVSSEVV